MKLLKKSFKILIATLLVAAFALTATACNKKNDTVYYLVDFVTNGGSEIDPQYVEAGGTVTKPDNPTRSGFTFVNWYDNSYTNVYDFETPVTENTTLYAMWMAGSGSETQNPDPDVPVGETVTVTLNLGYDNKTDTFKVAKNGYLPAQSANPTRTGYTFAGWYTDAACTVANAFSVSSAITKDTTLYAKWKADGEAAVDGDGINWSNYWSGGSGSVGGTDGFTFTKTVNIGSVTGPTVTPDVPANSSDLCEVKFNNNGGTEVATQKLSMGETVIKPDNPERDGYMFAGWKNGSNLYDFGTPVTTKTLTLEAQWVALDSKIESVKSYNESLAVEFQESNAAGATVSYAKKGDSTYTTVDKELVRKLDDSTARVDILGLSAGEYNVRITTSGGSTINLPETVTVDAYDHSGYAHYKYTEGVGAYKEDGTLKDDAIVIYVTEQNKNTVMKDLVDSGKYSYLQMFQIPYSGNGKNWNNKDAAGIGWWLNSAQYGMDNKNSGTNKRPSNTYTTNASNIGFMAINDSHPIVVRFIGTVTTPEGCSAFDSEDEGGSIGDNGNMARMKNLKNVTIEGVGEDAVIKGWGFHFMAGGGGQNGAGKNFEVRNLTFTEYTEDAVGMEGVQSGSSITAPVERCWVHNCTFLPGRCDNPAESDKKEGDGSCDFKRGQYFTLSYCYFEWCHKTNLIGSSDSSLQFNITMHHNMWYNCGSRIPLLRHANVHFYNNYVMGDVSAKSPYSHIAKAALSYVHSLRADCYMFSEANYYEGSKNVTDGKSGGAAKSWNDVFQACYGTDTMVRAKSRDESVSNNCVYQSTDYKNFDTNADQFYYNPQDKVSNCRLDDALTARLKVLQYAGANGFTPAGAKSDVAQNVPTAAVQIDETTKKLEINVAGIKSATTQNNVIFNTKAGKGKGQLITFTLAATTEVRVTTTTTGDPAPDLYSTDGRLYAEGFTGTVTLILPAGTYVIASGQKDKEATITNLVFADTEASAEERINNAKQLLNGLPEEISMNDVQKVEEAGKAYAALRADERAQVDASAVERYSKAAAALEKLSVEYVVARIDFIGTVTETSYIKINAAQNAYNNLDTEQRKAVTNYSTLTAAWTAYDAFAVKNVIARFKDLPDLSKATVTTRETLERLQNWFDAVEGAFNELSSEEDGGQQNQVKADDSGKTYKMLTDGKAALSGFENAINFTEALAEATANDGASGAKLVNLYNMLTEAQKTALSADDKTKFEGIKTAYEAMLASAKNVTFLGGQPSDNMFTHTGTKQNKKGKVLIINAFELNLATGLKFEGATELTLTLATKMKITFYLYDTNSLAVDGTPLTLETVNGDNVATVTLDAGTYKITRAKSEAALYYATLVPAA